ncbi:uncharacterized protein LOC113752275 [Coffea eugenioides]|uniref:uncharacterized protein LOC113752275 n=1 Tax=Coffea eugenioides TaxID=49369 RepID=UPI000F61252E|nr:uncharacterized protein LOC113752275 [Coffea eugenioides]
MKSQHPKLKIAPRPLFSCGFFRNCIQTVLSPTTTTSPTLPFPSFTQLRFPLTNSLISHHFIHPYQQTQEKPKISEPTPPRKAPDSLPPPQLSATKLEETFHVAELHFSSGSDEDKLGALHLLEKSLVPNPRAVADGGDAGACPATVMKWVVGCLKERVMAKSAQSKPR